MAAAPVLDFCIRKSVTKETDITNVLIEPKRIRNCLLFSSPVIFEPVTAAWLLPRPGKKEQIGETRTVAIIGLINSFFVIFIFSICCKGTFVLDFIEWMIVEAPKRPVKSGSSGCWRFKFIEAIPRKPARVKIIIAFILLSFSWRIKRITIQIRNIPSILSMKG